MAQLIHDNFKYSGTDDPSYVSSDGLDRIRKDSEVRLKIVGTCIENTEIVRTLPAATLSPLPSTPLQHCTTAVCIAVARHGEGRVRQVVRLKACRVSPTACGS